MHASHADDPRGRLEEADTTALPQATQEFPFPHSPAEAVFIIQNDRTHEETATSSEPLRNFMESNNVIETMA